MDGDIKKILLRAALRGEIDSDSLPEEIIKTFRSAQDLTPEEDRALREKVEELQANPERLRLLWDRMGLRVPTAAH